MYTVPSVASSLVPGPDRVAACARRLCRRASCRSSKTTSRFRLRRSLVRVGRGPITHGGPRPPRPAVGFGARPAANAVELPRRVLDVLFGNGLRGRRGGLRLGRWWAAGARGPNRRWGRVWCAQDRQWCGMGGWPCWRHPRFAARVAHGCVSSLCRWYTAARSGFRTVWVVYSGAITSGSLRPMALRDGCHAAWRERNKGWAAIPFDPYMTQRIGNGGRPCTGAGWNGSSGMVVVLGHG